MLNTYPQEEVHQYIQTQKTKIENFLPQTAKIKNPSQIIRTEDFLPTSLKTEDLLLETTRPNGFYHDEVSGDDKLKPSTAVCLWRPHYKNNTNMDKFRIFVNEKFNLCLRNYDDLYEWSVNQHENFWGTWWAYNNFVHSRALDKVIEPTERMSDVPKWFPGVRMNFAENLLKFRDDSIALYIAREGGNSVESVSYKCLYEKTRQYANSLKACGVTTGDRVAGYLPNSGVAVEAMLGTSSLGAIWSCSSPDFGHMGVLDRFVQIEPKILFSVESVFYNGKVHDNMKRLKLVVAGLSSLERVVVAPFLKNKEDIDISEIPNAIFLDEFLSLGRSENTSHREIDFVQLPFNAPQFIMFSSGTTGAPKCIVHSAGGTLIQLAKEHVLHTDITRNDIVMYYTTTGWMMWNWLVTSLNSGCSLVLFDGSPLMPSPNVAFDLIDQLEITVFGTGAKWLSLIEAKGLKPKQTHNLSSLRVVLSTGSPLSPSSFNYVYRDIKTNVLLGSITGGTDIISCFMGSNPTLPVHAGEIQSRNLGMAVQCWNEKGDHVEDVSGELVCTKPFPSMPTHFWNDPDNSKYMKAYFSQFSNVWTHGDYCQFNSNTGGITMYGRSDGTLNPNGVRFGSSEIYNIVERFPQVADSVCVGQRNANNSERVLLFIKTVSSPGSELPDALVSDIKQAIRTELSTRHVPSLILSVQDIPYTISGKKVEVAVRQVIQKQKVLNRSSLANPQSLDFFTNLPQLSDW